MTLEYVQCIHELNMLSSLVNDLRDSLSIATCDSTIEKLNREIDFYEREIYGFDCKNCAMKKECWEYQMEDED